MIGRRNTFGYHQFKGWIRTSQPIGYVVYGSVICRMLRQNQEYVSVKDKSNRHLAIVALAAVALDAGLPWAKANGVVPYAPTAVVPYWFNGEEVHTPEERQPSLGPA